jgi:hypothetical protein
MYNDFLNLDTDVPSNHDKTIYEKNSTVFIDDVFSGETIGNGIVDGCTTDFIKIHNNKFPNGICFSRRHLGKITSE